jgi:hypothetical protein
VLEDHKTVLFQTSTYMVLKKPCPLIENTRTTPYVNLCRIVSFRCIADFVHQTVLTDGPDCLKITASKMTYEDENTVLFTLIDPAVANRSDMLYISCLSGASETVEGRRERVINFSMKS